MSTSCAYCGNAAELTREHIVPSFLYKANPLAKFGYNLKADRFITWEAQIKDVCSRCNNDYLSKVDGYAKEFLSENKVDRLITNQHHVTMAYDFGFLCRFLLKVTFNCLRFKGQDTHRLIPFSDYILYGVDYPGTLGIKIGVEVLPCHKIADHERESLPDTLKESDYLPPHMIRIGQIIGLTTERLFARYVSINNFFFHLLIFKRSMPTSEFQTAVRTLSTQCPNVVFLDTHSSTVTVKVSSTDTMTRYADTAATLIDRWREFERGQG